MEKVILSAVDDKMQFIPGTEMEFECDTLQDFYYEWTKFEAEFKLGDMSQSYAIYDIDGYTLSVVSENPDEEFELFIQNDSDIIDDISESDFFNEEE